MRTRGSWARLFRCLSVCESCVLQYVAVCCSGLHRSVLQLFSGVSVCESSVFQYVAMCCNVLHRSVLQLFSCVSVYGRARARARRRGCVSEGGGVSCV